MKKLITFALILIVVLLVGCEAPQSKDSNSFEVNSKINEQSVQNIIKNDSLPQIIQSMERANIKKRIDFLNQPGRIGYLYLIL